MMKRSSFLALASLASLATATDFDEACRYCPNVQYDACVDFKINSGCSTLLADAASSGASVTKMSAEVTANSADDACDQWFFKANLASGSGACVASAAASAARRRRRLMSRFIR